MNPPLFKNSAQEAATAEVVPPPCRMISSRELVGEEREVLITHAGECYRLRVTRQNKLILTK